jgi:hypothetical protein
LEQDEGHSETVMWRAVALVNMGRVEESLPKLIERIVAVGGR